MKKLFLLKFTILFLLIISAFNLYAATRYKWIVVGSLQNFYHDIGNEYEVAVFARQQWGFCWDAFYRDQDMQAGKGMWIGAADFYDPVMERTYDYKVAHAGPRNVDDVEMREFMPQEIKLLARYPHPEVYVDGNEGSDMMNADNAKNDDIDEIDPSIRADRVVVNIVNTSLGITMTRKIYALSQQNFDNIHIHEFEFENTGIYNLDGDVYTQTLKDVYFQWQRRDAICQEGNWNGAYNQHRHWIQTSVRNVRWGYATMTDIIGADQENPSPFSSYIDKTGQDAMDHDGNWMRGYVAWLGYWSDFGYNNIGSPLVNGVAHNNYAAINDGRLGASQYKGLVVIHADTSPTDPSDDPEQPRTHTTIKSNNRNNYTAALNQYDADLMREKYLYHIATHKKESHAKNVWRTHGSSDGLLADAGAYSKANQASNFSAFLAFGPYTMEPGQKIKIVYAEAADGLGHDYGYYIGQLWYRARYQNETLDVIDPDNPTSTVSIDADNADEWKDKMVYSGRDSLINTFRKAIKLYKTGFYEGVPEAPRPPERVEIFSTEEGVMISWKASSAVSSPGFEGFRIYRAFIEKDSTYRQVLDCNISTGNLNNYLLDVSNDEFEFLDTQPLRGQNYYYYIESYDDGSRNQTEPGKPLKSSPFYTRTNRPATIKSPPAPNEKLNVEDYDLNDPADRRQLMHLLIRLVPNPINVRNEKIQFVGNVNKLLFAGVPEGCRIGVYTERGDFVTDIEQSEEGYAWYLTSQWQQILVSGVYIAHFEMHEAYENEKTGVRFYPGDTIIKKFIVVR